MFLLATGCQPRVAETATPTAPPLAVTPTAEAALPLNPLMGLEVADPGLLKMPAVLISISHFPATARPQAGLSFSPWVYEFYITEGATNGHVRLQPANPSMKALVVPAGDVQVQGVVIGVMRKY